MRVTAFTKDALRMRRLNKPVPSNDWRPIDTVPKDGREVLLWNPIKGGTHTHIYQRRWEPSYGVWSNEYRNGTEHGEWFKPTHWMPVTRPIS